jgi:hypothetical protein
MVPQMPERIARFIGITALARLRRVEECRIEAFKNPLFTPISRLLTRDAERRPRHCRQAPFANFTTAMHARSETTVLDQEQR